MGVACYKCVSMEPLALLLRKGVARPRLNNYGGTNICIEANVKRSYVDHASMILPEADDIAVSPCIYVVARTM